MVKLNIIWIDDDISRKGYADLVDAKFFLPNEALKNAKFDKADLVLIDYYLIGSGSKNDIKLNGLSIASQIQEKFHWLPIYIISNYLMADDKKDELFLCNNSFLKVLYLNNFDEKEIIEDAKSLRELRSNKYKSAEDIQNLLAAPQASLNRIKNAIPNNILQKGVGETERLFSLFKWIDRILIKYPGPLYDEEHLAAHLGVPKKTLAILKPKFKSAKYHGIFSESSKIDLWWSDEIDKIILTDSKAAKATTINIPVLVENIFSLKKDQLNKCAICSKYYPDILASEKETKDSYKNIHYSCSDEDTTKPQMQYFDNPRQFSLSKNKGA